QAYTSTGSRANGFSAASGSRIPGELFPAWLHRIGLSLDDGLAPARLLAAAHDDPHLVGLAHAKQAVLGIGRLELAIPHVRIETAEAQQLPVRPALDDDSVLEDDDLVRIDDGRKPVRDHQR